MAASTGRTVSFVVSLIVTFDDSVYYSVSLIESLLSGYHWSDVVI